MKNLPLSFRNAARILRKSPGFVAVAVLAVGFGVGVSCAVFTLLNAIALRPLPVPRPGDVVTVYQMIRGARSRNVHGDSSYFSYPEYEAYRDRNSSFASLAAYAQAELTIAGAEARQSSGDMVTCNYFDVLTGPLRLGRGFRPEECGSPGNSPVVVLSYRLWQRQFASNPEVLGKTIVLNGTTFNIIGVAPEGFNGASLISSEIWTPLSMQEQWVPNRKFLNDRGLSWLQLVGRLKAGVSLSQTRAEMSVIAAQLDDQDPPRKTTVFVDRATLMNIPQGHTAILAVGSIALIAVSLVILIACANLANLLMARAAGRQREIAIRIAVGASRSQLIHQLLTESLLLSVTGGLFGLLASWELLRVGLPLVIAQLPPEAGQLVLNLTPDIRIVGYSLALSLLTGVGFGLLPALQASRIDLTAALKESVGALGGARRRWLRSALVAMQVAICLVLLVAAGLLTRGLHAAQSIDPHLDMTNTAVGGFDLSRQGYDLPRSAGFHRQLAERLAGQGFEVAFVDPVPLSGSRNGEVIVGEGGKPTLQVNNATVSPHYFHLLGIPIVRGRAFEERDIRDNSTLAVFSESTARRMWPGEEPIGKTFRIGGQSEVWQVIGIARDVHSTGLAQQDETFIYFQLRSNDYRRMSALARSASGPSAAAQAIAAVARSLDPNVLVRTYALVENVNVWQVPSRVTAFVGLALGIAGLLLASMGIYGVVAFVVSQRTKEIGIRVSLGARRKDVMKMILLQTLRPAAAGIAVGLVLCAAVSQVLKSLLFGISPLDPIVFGGVSLFLGAVAVMASYIPARRAATVDPMIALRQQ